MGLSPSPTLVDVYSDHGMLVLAHGNLERVFGRAAVGEVIQNGCDSEGGSRLVLVFGTWGC